MDGESATGTIYIGDVEVWSGTATHDVSTEGGSGPELLSDNGCDECSGCEEGNCDSLEGGGLGSLKFRIPLGFPRKGQISGFAWFLTKEPLTVGVDTLQVLSRDDAQVTDTSVSGGRTIVCGDNRGRTLSIQPVASGIEVTITETDSGKLEHTWRILNADGSFTTNAYSCCRLLWSQDRTGRKVLRSAVTGEDHLYYAMEEVSLGQMANVKCKVKSLRRPILGTLDCHRCTRLFLAIIFSSREAHGATRGHSPENGTGQVHELSRVERVDRVEGELASRAV